MRSRQEGWAAVAKVSRAIAERAITEREGCIELYLRIGGEPRRLVRSIRAGVKLFEGRAPPPRSAAGLQREVRRIRAARAS